MFSKIAAITASLMMPAFALATQSDEFLSCHGDHHGSYVRLMTVTGSEGLAQVNAVVTTDADESEVPAKVFTLVEVTKNGAPLQLNAYSWAIRQAVKAEAAGEYYGYVKVKALGMDGKLLYMNLQKGVGLTNSLVIDGTAEHLACTVLAPQQ